MGEREQRSAWMLRAGGSQAGSAAVGEGLQLMGPLPTRSPTSGSHYFGNTHRWENVLGMFFHSRSRSQSRGAFPHSPPASALGRMKKQRSRLPTHAHPSGTAPAPPCPAPPPGPQERVAETTGLSDQ